MPSTFKVHNAKNITTALTAVNSYTVASSTNTTVIGLNFCNTSNNSINVTASVSNSSVDTYLVYNAPLPVGSALAVIGGDQKVVLQSSMSIKVSASANSACDVSMSILEIS